MNTKLKLLGLASILGLGTAAQGQVGIDVDLVAWDTVNGSSVTATDLNSLISGDSMVRNGNLAENTGGDFNSRGWSTEAPGDYISWSFTIAEGYELSNFALDIYMDRSNSGPSSMTLLWSDDDFATSSVVFSSVDPGSSGGEFNYGGFGSFVSGTIGFRLSGTGASSSAGTMDIETGEVGPGGSYGLAFTGDISAAPVPEPEFFGALAGVLVLGLAVVRRRRA